MYFPGKFISLLLIVFSACGAIAAESGQNAQKFDLARDLPEVVWIENFTDFNPDDCYIGVDSYLNDNHDFFVLTEPRTWQTGRIFNLEEYEMDRFTVEFDMRIGGGWGADGLVFAWGYEYDYDPAVGGRLDFYQTEGYGVEFDVWRNNEYNDPNGQHIAVVKDGIDTHLATWSPDTDILENNEWHHVMIDFDNGAVEVYFDDEMVIDHEIEDYQTFTGYFGFTAATGASTHWHCIDNISIYGEELQEELSVTVNSPSEGEVVVAGDEITIEWEVTGNVDRSVVFFSSDNGLSWTQIGETQGENYQLQWEIPDTFTLQGRIKVVVYDPDDNFAEGTSGIFSIDVTQSQSSFDLVPGWYLISLPLIPDDPAPEDVIGDNFEHQWAVYDFTYDRGYQNPDEMLCGPGYWVVVVHDTTILDMEGAANQDTVSLPLTISWNLIGCPFPAPVSLEDVTVHSDGEYLTMEEAANEGLVIPILTGCIVQEGYFETRTLNPWYGYWFMALEEGLELLIYPSERRPLRDEPPGGTPDDWFVRIDGEFEGACDEAFLGSHMVASDTFDVAYDFPEPPPWPENQRSLAMYFEHEEWIPEVGSRFNRDIRGFLNGEQAEWTLYAETSEPGEVVLTWADIDFTTPEQDYVFTLIDPATDAEIDMIETDEYTFNAGDERSELIIRVDIPFMGVDDNATNPKQPTEFVLLNAYPNPFNASTTISYSLTKRSDVSLGVYGANGSLIKNLFEGTQSAGLHKFEWNAGDAGAGIYFVRFHSMGNSAIEKIVLIK